MNKFIMLLLIIVAAVLAVKYLGAPPAGMYSCTPLASSLGICNPSQSQLVECTRGLGGEILEQIDEDVCPGEFERAAYYCLYGYGGRPEPGYWAFVSGCGTYTCSGSYVYDGQNIWKWVCSDAPPIVKPEPPQTLWNILSTAIMDWLKSVFRFFTGSITSSQGSVAPGQNIIFTVSLSSPIDSNCNDGSCQVQYASWAVVDKSGVIVQSSPWKETLGSWSESVTVAAPSTAGDYAFVAVLYNYNMRYGVQWQTDSEGIAAREAVEFTVGIPGVVKPVPSAGLLGSIINSIFNFIRSLFGWLV